MRRVDGIQGKVVMFDWITKTPMQETLADNINETICIVVTLAIIGAAGLLADRFEQRCKRRNKKHGKREKVD